MEMTRNASTCLSGIAIIAVVLSHVAFQNSFLGELLGRAGVFAFLLVSGYGIAKSNGMEKLDLRKYVWRRFERVVVPYWTVLALHVLRFTFISQIHVEVRILLMNYAFLVFVPYDLITDAWFVPYILLWYALYAIASMLPLKAVNDKVYALFLVPVVLLLASPAIVSFMSAAFKGFSPGAFHFLFIPYALAFPLGAYLALVDKSAMKVDFDNAVLRIFGKYAYWIYLLHVPVLHALIAVGILRSW